MKKQKLLLHVCCGPCAIHVINRLQEYFDVSLFFYNPCIYPTKEHEKRLEELKKVANIYECKVYTEIKDYEDWKHLVKGFEKEAEGGNRCKICINDRMNATAKKAKELGVAVFGTTLTVSPHKDSEIINDSGKNSAIRNKIDYLVSDFKKNNGYKKSVELSKKHEIYRQNYCGCEFSIRD